MPFVVRNFAMGTAWSTSDTIPCRAMARPPFAIVSGSDAIDRIADATAFAVRSIEVVPSGVEFAGFAIAFASITIEVVANATAFDRKAIEFAGNAIASGSNATEIESDATAIVPDSIAFALNATEFALNSVEFGPNAIQFTANSVAFASNSVAKMGRPGRDGGCNGLFGRFLTGFGVSGWDPTGVA
jgi:hypothetical protein